MAERLIVSAQIDESYQIAMMHGAFRRSELQKSGMPCRLEGAKWDGSTARKGWRYILIMEDKENG